MYADWFAFASMGLVGMVVVGLGKGSRRLLIPGALAILILLIVVAGCGGHQGTAGTPPGTSTVTVTGSTTSFIHATTFTLTVN
jgi:hypothetical protein